MKRIKNQLDIAAGILALFALWLLNALMLVAMTVAGALGVAMVLWLLTRAVRLGWGC